MMNAGLISRRYAKALYEYALGRNEEQALYQRMQTLSSMLRDIPKLRDTLSSPVVPVKYKQEILREAAGRAPEQSYLDFIGLILKNNRESMLYDITLSYQTYYRRRKNISIVHLTSAGPMSEEMLTRIRRQVEKRTRGEVEFSAYTDPAVGGGFIFQLNDMRLDASVRGQLARLKRQLLASSGTRMRETEQVG